MASVLQKFLSMNGVLTEILQYQKNLQNCIMQGSVWKNIVASNKENDSSCLPVILFYDDFEVGNPLGSHAGIHKLGGVYLSLPFLPSHYVSQLRNIFMLALFHSSDRIRFGNKVVFEPIIQQLNFLSNAGINVSTDVYEGVIKFRVVCISGDNFGLNSMLGFVESFVANHCCRICTANKQQLQSMQFQDENLLLTIDKYERSFQNGY